MCAKKRLANGPLQFCLFRCNRWERILRVFVIFWLEMCHQKEIGRLTNTECKPMFDRSLVLFISTGISEMARIYHGEIEPPGSTRFPYQAQAKKAFFLSFKKSCSIFFQLVVRRKRLMKSPKLTPFCGATLLSLKYKMRIKWLFP